MAEEGQQPQGGNEPGTPAGTQTPAAEPERRFTQAELDAKIDERLRREREARERQAAKEREEAEAQKLAEQQKFQELAQKHEQRAQQLAAELEAREARIAALQLEQAVEREASTLGFADPADAHHFLDLAAVQRDANGTPTNVKGLLEAVLTAKPYLKGTAASGSAGVPATPRPAGAPSSAQIVAQTKEEMRQSGRYAF